MSATRDQRLSAIGTRDDVNARASRLGHDMTWRLGPNATRRGFAYFFAGECGDCGARATAGVAWSSCDGVRDARREPCSGPGTKALTEVEDERCRQLVAEAVREFGEQVHAARARCEDDVIAAYENELGRRDDTDGWAR